MEKIFDVVELAFFFALIIATDAVFILFALVLCSKEVAFIATVFAVMAGAMVICDKLGLIE